MTQQVNADNEAQSTTPTEANAESPTDRREGNEQSQSWASESKTPPRSTSVETDVDESQPPTTDLRPSPNAQTPAPDPEELTPSQEVAHDPDRDAYPPLPSSHSHSPSERYAAWKTFTLQHEEIVKKRVQADELRRKAQMKRRDFIDMCTRLPVALYEDVTQSSEAASEQRQTWSRSLSELEQMEAELGQVEDELVQAESAVSRTLPRILGHEEDRTFGVLEDNELYFQIDSESDRLDPDAGWEDEVSPEVIRYQEKLDEVDALEVQLMEMADDRRRLWDLDENDLRATEISFLETYATRRSQIKGQLHTARSELEGLRNELQPAPLPEDEPPQQSDPLQSHDTARDPLVDIQQVEHWLDDTQGSSRQGE